MFELIGETMFTQLTIGLMISIELIMILFPFLEVISNPILQTQKMYILNRSRTFTQT